MCTTNTETRPFRNLPRPLTPDSLCAKHPLVPYLALLALALVLLLPGFFTLPPMDRDESRFVQATRQMVDSGDYIDIRFQDQARHKKPVGIYWLQALSVRAFGSAWGNPVWPYRVPSLLGTVGAVLVCFAIGKRLFDAPTAFLGAAFLAASLVVNLEARTGKTDAFMFLTIVVAQACLARIYLAAEGGGKAGLGWAIAMWAALGVGGLIKGPIPLMITGLTALTLAGWQRKGGWLLHLRPLRGILLMALLVTPWLIAIHQVSGGAFFVESVQDDLLGKVASGSNSHAAPPGYYLLTFFVFFWPASLLAGLAIPWVWRHRDQPEIRFCLAWLLPNWLVFELFVTKLPHYVMPTYPAVALLTALALRRGGLAAVAPAGGPGPTVRKARFGRFLRSLWLWLWLFFTAAIGGLFFAVSPVVDRVLHPAGVFAGVAVLTAGLIGWGAFRHRDLETAAPRFVAIAILAYGMGFGVLMPNLEGFWVSRRLAAEFDRLGTVRAALAGYQEPSAVFLIGTETMLTGYGEPAGQWLIENPGGAVAVDRRQKDDFLAAVELAGLPVEARAVVDGFNYSKGQFVEMTVYTVASDDESAATQSSSF